VTGLRVEGTDDFERFARALKEAADKDLSRNVGKALRTIGKPLGERVIRKGAERMPHRGGFAGLVAEARVGMRFSQSANPSVQLLLKDRSNHDLKSLDTGILRHPVFLRNRKGLRKTARGKTGHVLGGTERKGWTWVAQRVPAGEFTKAFEAEAPRVANDAITAVQKTLDDAARKA
jgi:hypothetical protein